MTTSQDKIANFAALNPKKYPVIGSLQLTQGIGPSGECEQTVLVLLQKELDDVTNVLRMEFYGVRALTFAQTEWSLLEVDFLEVIEATDVPDGTGKYRVQDASHERVLQFECRDFTARLA
jgi:hypothetical protein